MYKFIKTADPENRYDISNVEVIIAEHTGATATQIAEEFGRFLLASGFTYDTVKSILAEDIDL